MLKIVDCDDQLVSEFHGVEADFELDGFAVFREDFELMVIEGLLDVVEADVGVSGQLALVGAGCEVGGYEEGFGGLVEGECDIWFGGGFMMAIVGEVVIEVGELEVVAGWVLAGEDKAGGVIITT